MLSDIITIKEDMLKDHAAEADAATSVNYRIQNKVVSGKNLNDAIDEHEAEIESDYANKKAAIKDLRKRAKG